MKDKGYGVAENWNYITISIIFFVIITLIVMYAPNCRELDTNILHHIQSMLSCIPIVYAHNITNFGTANWWLWPQITVSTTLISHRKYIPALFFVAYAQILYNIIELIKNYVCRERPCGHSYIGFSFPSGHSAITMFIYGTVIYLILRHVRNDFWRYCLSIILGIFIALVAISRMWINVHFPTDVLAGLFLGFIFVNLYIITIKVFKS